jgi:alkylated DNA repair protein (DNA oxidative demethylase)
MRRDQSARDDLFGGMRTVGLGEETLAEGAVVLRGFVGADSGPIFEAVQQVAASAPFRHMVTPGGHCMSAG